MAKRYPLDFRRDVVAVARKGDATLAQISKDFGISNATLHNWLKKADVEDWVRPGLTEADAQELRVLKKRNRVLEQEVEILKRAAAYFARELSPNDLPTGLDLARDGFPVSVTCRVLGFST